MDVKVKKLEVLNIEDIRSSSNSLLSDRTNHYLQNMLFYLRLLFRYNSDGLDDFIDLYYYIVDLLDEKILFDLDELKIFIYRISDLVINFEDYDLAGSTLITEVSAKLLESLYLELETYRLVDKTDDVLWKDVLVGQLRNQVVDFDVLISIFESCDDDSVRDDVSSILSNNFPFEFAIYRARHDLLFW